MLKLMASEYIPVCVYMSTQTQEKRKESSSVLVQERIFSYEATVP